MPLMAQVAGRNHLNRCADYPPNRPRTSLQVLRRETGCAISGVSYTAIAGPGDSSGERRVSLGRSALKRLSPGSPDRVHGRSALSLSPGGGERPASQKGVVPRSRETRSRTFSVMILPQVHLRKPCYDFYFL